MKKLLILALALCSYVGFAQQDVDKAALEKIATEKTEVLAKKLKLSDSQKQAVFQLESIRAYEKQQGVEENTYVAYDRRMQAVLNDEQYAKFLELRKKD